MIHRISTPLLLSVFAIGCTSKPEKSAEPVYMPAGTAASAPTTPAPVEREKPAAATEKASKPVDPPKSSASVEKPTTSVESSKPAGDAANAAPSAKTASDVAKPAATAQAAASNDNPAKPAEGSLLELKANSLDGKPVDLSTYRGKVALVVNVASECGYTLQYAGLEKLYEELADRGFVVLGFPSNDFGGQEPGTAEQIQTFCRDKYDVRFPMFSKVETKSGPGQSTVYAYLGAATGKLPNWNFCKYLVGKDGTAIAFYPSKVKPDDAEMRKAIDTALAAK